MGVRWFLAIAAVAFLMATVASDVFASVTISGLQLADAVKDHFYWAGVEFGGTLMLFAPFGFLAVIASWVEEKTRTWKAALLFAVPALFLTYSYFQGYRASHMAALHKQWTAAALSVGLLPFLATPVVLIACLVGLVLVRLSDQGRPGYPRAEGP